MMDRAELLAKAEKATPGPWEALPEQSFPKLIAHVVAPAGDAEFGNWMVAERVRWPENAAYIAAASPANIIELLRGMDALEAENARLNGRLLDTVNQLDRALHYKTKS